MDFSHTFLRKIKRAAVALLCVGVLLSGIALFAMSNVSPVGTMDCGCGGGTTCVTKVRTGSTGVMLLSGGMILFLGASMLGATLIREKIQSA